MASIAEKLAAMRAKLAAAQSKKNTEKLSERNMIEIMGKLKELGRIEVIPTTDARSYVTPQKLQSEIIENVNSYGYGRLSIAELSEVLLVDFTIVEKHAEIVLAENSDSIQMINGQLVTSEYFDKLAVEIGDLLSISGRVTLSSLAIQHDLPLKIVQKELCGRLEASGFYLESDRAVTTDLYNQRAERQILGVIRAVMGPTDISVIKTFASLDNNYPLFETLKKLISSGQVQGEILGKSTYIPNVYYQAQLAWIKSTFKSNLFIDYSQLSKIGIVSGQRAAVEKALGKSLVKSLIELDNGLLSSDLLANVEAALIEVENCIDIDELALPTFVNSEDYERVLEGNLDSEKFLLMEGFIITKNLMQKSREVLDGEALKAADIDATKRFKSGAVAPPIQAEKSSKKPAKKGKGKKGRKARDDDSDDDFDEDKGKSGAVVVSSSLPSLEQLSNKVERVLTGEDNDLYGLPFDKIAEILYKEVKDKYSELVNDLVLQKQHQAMAGKRETRRTLETKIQEKFDLLRISFSGLEPIIKDNIDETLIAQTTGYLLKNVGQEILDMLLILATEMSLDEILFDKQAPNLIAAAERKRLKASLTSGPGRDKLSEKTDGLDFTGLQEHIYNLAALDCCSVRLKSDKKNDKEYMLRFVDQQKEAFESAAPHDKLYICAIMSYHNLTKQLIWTAGKCVPGVISFLSRISTQNRKMDDIIDMMTSCQDMVIDNLRNRDGNADVSLLNTELDQLFAKINETSVNLSPTLQRRTSRQSSRKKESESESFDDFVKTEKPEFIEAENATIEKTQEPESKTETVDIVNIPEAVPENSDSEEEVVVVKKSSKGRRRRAD